MISLNSPPPAPVAIPRALTSRIGLAAYGRLSRGAQLVVNCVEQQQRDDAAVWHASIAHVARVTGLGQDEVWSALRELRERRVLDLAAVAGAGEPVGVLVAAYADSRRLALALSEWSRRRGA